METDSGQSDTDSRGRPGVKVAGPYRRPARRVVLRAGSRRKRVELADESETCDSASEPENIPLDNTAHYDTRAWVSTPKHDRRNVSKDGYPDCEELEDGISTDVFQEKLELSGRILHSTPAHPGTREGVAHINHPMHPSSVSSAIFREHSSDTLSSSDENDDVFLRPRAAVHPESLTHHHDSSTFNNTLPPHAFRLHTSPGHRARTSTNSFTSPMHSHKLGKLGRKNRIHPLEMKLPSPAHLKSTSSSNASHGRLSLSSTVSTLPPLLTTNLRKGGTRPSADVSWDCDGESVLENFFPDRHVRVFVVTWNMHEEKVSKKCGK